MATFVQSSITSNGKSGVYCVQLNEIQQNEQLFNAFMEAIERNDRFNGIEESDDASFTPVTGFDSDGYPIEGEPVIGPFAWCQTTFVCTRKAKAILKTGKHGQYFGLSEIKSLAEMRADRDALRSKTKTASKPTTKVSVSPEDAEF
jgi:hypothetical protein